MIHTSLAVVTFVLCPLSLYHSQPFESASCRPQRWWLSLLHSVCHSIRSSEVDMLCFRSSMLVRSFTVNNISGTRHQPLLRAIRNLFVIVEYCCLLEFYVKCAALYRTFIPQPFWNARCGRPRGSKFHLTRSLVASEVWSLVSDRTNRKHCPSHEIWSYKRDGRWWEWSFDRGSTVMAGMAVFYVAGYLLEERRRWPIITDSPRGQCSKQMFRWENLTSHLVGWKTHPTIICIAPVGDWTHDLPHTVASNMVKVSHARRRLLHRIFLVLSYEYSKQPIFGQTQEWLREVWSPRQMICLFTTRVGSFTSPGIDTR